MDSHGHSCDTCDDIEDMSIPDERLEHTDSDIVNFNVQKPRKTNAANINHVTSKKGKHRGTEDSVDSCIPGTQTIWLKTMGCSHNVSDSEYMQGALAAYGYKFSEDPEEADLWLVNSCTVKDPSQAAFVKIVMKAQELSVPVVVAGCVPQAERSMDEIKSVTVVGVQQIHRVVEAVEETLKGNTVRMLGRKGLPSLDLPKIRRNPLVEIVPLSTGCLGACTYCKTIHARGKLGSYTIEALTNRVKTAISEGVTEIWLSSEDTGAYGIDLGTSLADLLDAVVPLLPEGVMLRLGMTNPPYVLGQLEAVARALNHPNVYSFIHVPVQAGSNAVLGRSAMNREYTVEDFKTVCDTLIQLVPGVTIATDVICGFPGETEEQFQETLDLIAQYKLAIVNISQFYPRPGTPAAKMKRTPSHMVKDRSRRMTSLFYTFTPYVDLVNTTTTVWIGDEVTDNGEHTVGHTKSYVKVLLPRDDNMKGSVAEVQITSASRFHVEGTVTRFITVPSHAQYKLKVERERREKGSTSAGRVVRLNNSSTQTPPKLRPILRLLEMTPKLSMTTSITIVAAACVVAGLIFTRRRGG